MPGDEGLEHSSNYLNLPNPTFLSVLIINPNMEFIGTRQKSRFWWVKVGFSHFNSLPQLKPARARVGFERFGHAAAAAEDGSCSLFSFM